MIHDVIDYILELYPLEWLTALQREPDEFGEAGVTIHHPGDKTIKLDIVITENIVGVAVIKESESDIELDLGGFDYSFEEHEIESLKQFLRAFHINAKVDEF